MITNDNMELSPREKELITCIALQNRTKVSDLKASLNLPANEFSVYRDRLIRKGLVDGRTRGSLLLTLPFFEDYIKEHSDLRPPQLSDYFAGLSSPDSAPRKGF